MSLEHTGVLGNTVEAIALEKAGIIKERPLWSPRLAERLWPLLKKSAGENAPFTGWGTTSGRNGLWRSRGSGFPLLWDKEGVPCSEIPCWESTRLTTPLLLWQPWNCWRKKICSGGRSFRLAPGSPLAGPAGNHGAQTSGGARWSP